MASEPHTFLGHKHVPPTYICRYGSTASMSAAALSFNFNLNRWETRLSDTQPIPALSHTPYLHRMVTEAQAMYGNQKTKAQFLPSLVF